MSIPPSAVPTTTPTRSGVGPRVRAARPSPALRGPHGSGSGTCGIEARRRDGRPPPRRAPGRSRRSFLTSPPRVTRRSLTGKPSISLMPDTPVTSPAQKPSRSWPMAVTTPAPLMAIGDTRGTRAPVTRRPPDVVEVEPLVPVRTDVALQDRHRGAERLDLGPSRHRERRLDVKPVGPVRLEHAERREPPARRPPPASGTAPAGTSPDAPKNGTSASPRPPIARSSWKATTSPRRRAPTSSTATTGLVRRTKRTPGGASRSSSAPTAGSTSGAMTTWTGRPRTARSRPASCQFPRCAVIDTQPRPRASASRVGACSSIPSTWRQSPDAARD